MTNAPYVLPKARDGARMGSTDLVDAMIHDGLWSTFTDQHMGESSDDVNAELGISREDQDAWAARSHQRAAAAWEAGRLAEEVVPVEVPQRKGDPVVVGRDEGIRADTTAESLGEAGPAFRRTARSRRERLADLRRRGRDRGDERSDEAEGSAWSRSRRSSRTAWRPSATRTCTRCRRIAMQNALKKAGLDVARPGLVEINEAFAVGGVQRDADARAWTRRS